jgi:hypothetical protein
MGLLVVLAVVAAVVLVVAFVVHALRADPDTDAHGWLLVVPLILLWAFVLQQLLVG